MGSILMVGAVFLALLNSVAIAGERENALGHIAQVSAAQVICSKVEAVEVKVAAIAYLYGVDFERDKTELTLQAQNHISAFKGMSEDMACVAGMALYGPNGSNVPGLLKWK